MKGLVVVELEANHTSVFDLLNHCLEDLEIAGGLSLLVVAGRVAIELRTGL